MCVSVCACGRDSEREKRVSVCVRFSGSPRDPGFNLGKEVSNEWNCVRGEF